MAKKRNITLEDLRRFKMVSDPQISPDSEIIAFVLSTINYKENTYERHIWMVERIGGNARQFTFGTGSDTFPRWSPDGSRLLFLSSRKDPISKKSQLWVIPRSGGEARMVADNEQGISSPRWSPNGKQILFLSNVWEDKAPGTDVKRIQRIKYKEDGVGFFEGRRKHLFTVRVGSNAKQRTSGAFDVETARWAPAGKGIAFITNMEKDADTSQVRDIYLISTQGSKPQKITEGVHVISDLSWSPDGSRLAFVGHDKPEGLAVNRDVWVMPAKGGLKRNLTKALDQSLGQSIGSDVSAETPDPGPVWSPDGNTIYFVTASIPYAPIYKIDAGGGPVQTVVKDKTIDGFSFSADGTVVAFNALDATHPAEIWVADAKGERRLTRFNDGLLSGLSLVVPERFTFTNGLGEKIDGWIIKPPDFNPRQKYPALLEIHGGPRAVYGDGMSYEFQILAAQGYAVFYTNPRGSAGYGEAYAESVMGHYGECDYEDLMVFVDETLRRNKWVDRKRLGVLGGSYGGYMTNWIICHTNRFRAAVTFRSICNWVSKFGTSDIGYLQPENISGTKDYCVKMNSHLKRSPIAYVKNVKTPVLIVHSEKDIMTKGTGDQDVPVQRKFRILLHDCVGAGGLGETGRCHVSHCEIPANFCWTPDEVGDAPLVCQFSPNP